MMMMVFIMILGYYSGWGSGGEIRRVVRGVVRLWLILLFLDFWGCYLVIIFRMRRLGWVKRLNEGGV